MVLYKYNFIDYNKNTYNSPESVIALNTGSWLSILEPQKAPINNMFKNR